MDIRKYRDEDRYLAQPPHLIPILLRQLLENSKGTGLTYKLEVILNILNQLIHLPQQLITARPTVQLVYKQEQLSIPRPVAILTAHLRREM